MASVSLTASGRTWYLTVDEPIVLHDVKTGSSEDIAYAAAEETYTLVTDFNTDTKSFSIDATAMPH